MAKAPAKKASVKEARPRGRPLLYTPEIADRIIKGLSKGTPLVLLCEPDDMPATRTVNDWAGKEPPPGVPETFAADFARARDDGWDYIAADTLTIADNDTRDWEPVKDSQGVVIGVKVDGEHVTRSKLRIETRLKLLAKWDPRRYGEMVKLNHGGPDGEPLELDDTAAFARMAGILEDARRRRDGDD